MHSQDHVNGYTQISKCESDKGQEVIGNVFVQYLKLAR